MAALLGDATALQDDDVVGHAHGGEAVGDEQGRPPGGELAEALVDLVLGLGVQGGGGLVQHQQLGASRMKPGRGPPSATPPESSTRPGEHAPRVVSYCWGRRSITCTAPSAARGAGDALRVRQLLHLAEADVVPRGELEAGVVLEDDGDLPAQVLQVELAKVRAVQEDRPAVGS